MRMLVPTWCVGVPVCVMDEDGSEETLCCELCNVATTSHENMHAHLRGRAHVVMVQRSEIAERSVYIRGFSNVPGAKDDLSELMGQFGSVVSVAVVTKGSNVYALVEFATADAALSALRHPSSLTLHNNTLTIKPRLLKTDKIPKRPVVQGQRKRLNVEVGSAGECVGGTEEGKKEKTKKSKKRKRKEREEEKVGGIHLPEEAATALSEARSVELQLQTLASHSRLSNSTAEDQLLLAWQLRAKLCHLLPSCVVVPFGAPFSGHGTLSSDCDLCLLSNPSPLELSLFLGPAYLPSHLHPVWERLQTMPPPPAQGESGGGGEVGMEELLTVLRAEDSYSAVWALLNARVPIIQFTCGQLNCDLSLNNRLGPANTRLLAAYMNFDPRMGVLVPCVRLWVRGWSLGRRQLNNYAVSLMLIYCLQHSTPPVLPCLQEPGVWPRNMAWIGSRGLAVEQQVTLDGWDCTFTDPHSLLPSSNTATPAQLLLHFFKYFSEEFSFSQRIVAIHTTSSLPVPARESSQGFRVSAVCVQDPFERVHNVTKNMTGGNCAHLCQALSKSRQLLAELLEQEQSDPSSRQDVTPLFKHDNLKPVPMSHTTDLSRPENTPTAVRHKSFPGQSPTGSHCLQLSLETLSRLLHDIPFASLEGRLEELDVRNTFVCQQLDHVVLHTLVHHFQKDYGVTAQFLKLHKIEETQTVSVPSGGSEGTPVTSERKRERSPDEDQEEEMEVEEGEGGFEVKRQRLEGGESAEALLCRLTEGVALDGQAQCVAVEESWVGARRRRRQQERDGSSASPDPQTPAPTTPCLSFFLSVSSQQHVSTNTISVVMHDSDSQFKLAFERFFSVCKNKYFH